jgi:hypothetical protein
VIEVVAVLGDGQFALNVNGHEGHVLEGRLCAAVSAITQTALLGLEELGKQYPGLMTVAVTTKE